MAVPDMRSSGATKVKFLLGVRVLSRVRKFFLRREKSTGRKTLLASLIVLVVFLLAVSLGFRDDYTEGLQRDNHKLFVDHKYFDEHIVPTARSKWSRKGEAENMDTNEHWSSVKNDVVFGIKTGHEVAAQRIEKLKNAGWWSVGRDVPNIIGISDEDNISLGVVGIKRYALDLMHVNNFSKSATDHTEKIKPVSGASFTAEELPPPHWFDTTGWKGDKDKNLPAFHLMRSIFPGKKWYLLLDDDTYIFLENFAHYILQQGMDEKPVYTGKVFLMAHCGGFGRDGSWTANKSEPKGVFAHGGSGIVMNSLAMDKVYPQLGNCIRRFSSCWAGDIQVGLCMRSVGVGLHNYIPRRSSERHFIPFSPSKSMSNKAFTKRWVHAEEPLTFHKIDIAEEESVSEFERLSIIERKPFVYNRLLDFLLRSGIQPPPPKKSKWVDKTYTDVYLPKGSQTGADLADQLFPGGLS